MKKVLLSTLLLLFIHSSAQSQLIFTQNFGGQIGLSYNLGTHFNLLGIMIKMYCHYDYVQANFQLATYYNFRTFAIEKPSWESQIRLGIVAAWGKKDNKPTPFLNETSNQTGRAYSVGYSYNFYIDNAKTSQMTGTFGFGIHDFSFMAENDYFAIGDGDKYRTGTMTLAYRVHNTQFVLQHAAWTGDPYAAGTSNVDNQQNFPSDYGYREMQNAPYSRHSVGIISVGVEQSIGFGQYLGANIGIDADRIRNFIQNELIHENRLLKNPHIPMIDTNGNQYLYKEGQKVRAPKFFLQFLANSGLFY